MYDMASSGGVPHVPPFMLKEIAQVKGGHDMSFLHTGRQSVV